MNKKKLLAILLVVLGAGIVIFSLWPKIESPEIKIATNSPTGLLFTATEKNFFEKEGLKAKLEIMPPEDSLFALLAGRADYAHLVAPATKPFIEASLRGAPIRIIMLTGKHQIYFLVSQPELDLKGLKTIGIIPSASERYQVLKFIEENHLEVEIIPARTPDELRTLLTLGMTDAILLPPPPAIQLQTQGFPVLDTLIETLPPVLIARDDKIEKAPKEAQKVIRALEQAMKFLVTRPEETKELLLKLWRLEQVRENFVMMGEVYPLVKNEYNRKNIPTADVGAKLLIQIAKAGEFETAQEVEEQIVTPEELQKVFDFRFVE